jgi:hypothetical protein
MNENALLFQVSKFVGTLKITGKQRSLPMLVFNLQNVSYLNEIGTEPHHLG